jgi:hypothetical protein
VAINARLPVTTAADTALGPASKTSTAVAAVQARAPFIAKRELNI